MGGLEVVDLVASMVACLACPQVEDWVDPKAALTVGQKGTIVAADLAVQTAVRWVDLLVARKGVLEADGLAALTAVNLVVSLVVG